MSFKTYLDKAIQYIARNVTSPSTETQTVYNLTDTYVDGTPVDVVAPCTGFCILNVDKRKNPNDDLRFTLCSPNDRPENQSQYDIQAGRMNCLSGTVTLPCWKGRTVYINLFKFNSGSTAQLSFTPYRLLGGGLTAFVRWLKHGFEEVAYA